MDLNEVLENAVREGIREGIKQKFSNQSYNSPLQKMMDDAILSKANDFREVLEQAIGNAVSDKTFREEIISETRSRLAKLLVNRFGGELEKQVNALKSDPMTRARIAIAIEEIIKEKN